MDNQQPSFQISLTPLQMFLAGIGTGLLVLCTIGFFIMLSLYFGGGNALAKVNNNRIDLGTDSGTGNAPAAAAPAAGTVRAVDTKRDHVRGNVNGATVTLVEYSDFECPFCKRFHETMQKVIQNYGKDVRWVYRHMPLDSLHRQARKEALASECASEQGKFWEFADLVFKETTSNDGLDLNKLPDYAKQLGLNVSKFTSCVDSAKYASVVQADEQDGQAAGAQGTPYTVVLGANGKTQVVNGAQPYEAVEAAVKAML